MNIQTAEHVSYHHTSVGYVRGKWNRKDRCKSSMLMSKCCHDLDLIAWLKGGIAPRSVASFGGLMHFKRDNAPEGSGERCLVDCLPAVEEGCLYSARKIYLDHPERWATYVWSCIEHIANPTLEDKARSLMTDNPHGRCIFKCDNDVVDHQSVMIQFADGSTATHSLVAGASEPCRTVRIVGTDGEIEGKLEEGFFHVKRPDPRCGHEFALERVEVNVSNESHGGGDHRLVEDFIRVVQNQSPSLSTTTIEESIHGHLIGFAADQAMAERRVVVLPSL
jgi:predicted dehydrogenase